MTGTSGGEPVPGEAGAPAAAPAGGRDRARDAVFLRVVLVGGALLAVGLAVVLFFVGTAVGGAADARGSDPGPAGVGAPSSATATPAPTPSPTPAPTPSPDPAAAALPTGPAAPGVQDWDALAGGECISGFTSPWSEQFTVVDCAGEHTAQLVTRGLFTDPADPASATALFPGEAELTGRLNLLCTAPAVLDYAAAEALPDVQWQAAYPVTEAEWTAGDRSYYCFFSRASGEPLGASLVAPPA
ncbi:hypothetical protein N1028_05015 [Herbiconiux sp. CPCC 203407]|uniref:Septum formation-related domain-containing protein n=1 Tax=Herbiconiux oxytropis TaxID=2970915 RepID=A0AA41XBN4_9MICO|nr:hypothetical protein [Herbiconiux oxytropis]MCS5723751.1 hypothetical protein [Herbiconiux oxytropis]MCS5725251.1 hypothetical protein [Herbiconiux oxytropis]